MLERRVSRVNNDLRHNGHDRLLDAAPPELVVERLLYHVADFRLGLSVAGIERDLRQPIPGKVRPDEDEPDLRTVAVGDNDLVAGLNDVRDVPAGLGGGGQLVGKRALVLGTYERIAANGEHGDWTHKT